MRIMRRVAVFGEFRPFGIATANGSLGATRTRVRRVLALSRLGERAVIGYCGVP